MAQALQHGLALVPLCGDFAVEAVGVDIGRPLDDATVHTLRDAFDRHRVLVVRGQNLPPAAHAAFTRHFGTLEIHVLNEYHRNAHPEIFELSNIGPDGRPNAVHPDRGTLFWHSGGSFQKTPALATLLYAEQVPGTGGHTLFADMIGAFEALGAAERAQFARLLVLHDLHVSRQKAGYARHRSAPRRRQIPRLADEPLVAVDHFAHARCDQLHALVARSCEGAHDGVVPCVV